MKRIFVVIGARPQFIKHAALDIAFKSLGTMEVFTVHTGQHYDENMSEVFFKELNITPPNIILNTGSYQHGKQTGLMLIELEKLMLDVKPDAIMVYGDTNSTLAGALAGAKLHIPVIHIEAGLRSFNKKMPEEINRVVTDHISNLLFAPSRLAVNNLQNEKITGEIYEVGDVMFDLIQLFAEIPIPHTEDDFYLVTLHRPYNTDNIERLRRIFLVLNELKHKVVFPIHPRTSSKLIEVGLQKADFKNVEFIEPQGYSNMISLLRSSRCLITDSGGMQKEAYWLKKKCVTIRSETEWVETLQNGWNTLIFENLEDIAQEVERIPHTYLENLYGDGKAAKKIVEVIGTYLNK